VLVGLSNFEQPVGAKHGHRPSDHFLTEGPKKPYSKIIAGDLSMPHTSTELNLILHALAKRYAAEAQKALADQLVSIALYGSVARNEARPSSDIDLYVVLQEAPSGMLSRRRLLEAVRESLTAELEALWGQDVYADFVEVIRTREEARKFHPLYLDMSREAILLFDRDQFLENLLEKVKERLKSGGADRKVMGNFWYWDLSRSSILEEVAEP
jgi:predicted nucleotidyltransferase